jgi:hypothetical protein
MKRKKLRLHVNREIAPREAPTQSDHIEPIVETRDPARGLLELKVRDASGARIGFFQVSEGELDDELVNALRDWQARHAHAGVDLSLLKS